VALLYAMAVASPAHATTEYELKAAFIYNVLRFTDWPELSKNKPFSLCVLGRDPFGAAMDGIRGRTVKDRKLDVRSVASVAEAQHCQAVYVSVSEEARLPQILSALASAPVLTISGIDNFADRGGYIGLLLVNDKLRFDVNLAALRAGNLRINAQVLKLARRVVETTENR
jgi:hypothetical protein